MSDASHLDEPTAEDKAKRIESSARLFAAIAQKTLDKQLRQRDIPDLLGITQSYWTNLKSGDRDIAALAKPKMRKLAEFLDIPLVQAYVMADAFDISDFVIPTDEERELNKLLDAMRVDPRWMALAPTTEEWQAMSQRTKLLTAALFEEATHQRFLTTTKAFVASTNTPGH